MICHMASHEHLSLLPRKYTMASVSAEDVTAPGGIALPTYAISALTLRPLNLIKCMLQAPELTAELKAELQQQAEKFEGQISSNPGDLEALEGAGVTYAQLGDYKRAEGLLAKLTGAKFDDAEAWRLLVREAFAWGSPVSQSCLHCAVGWLYSCNHRS